MAAPARSNWILDAVENFFEFGNYSFVYYITMLMNYTVLFYISFKRRGIFYWKKSIDME